MKFRNKKTGEKYEAISHEPIDIYFYTPDGSDGFTKRSYDSIADLNEEWEDYKPAEPKEPLIKDEKICKAIRAWAEAIGVSRAMTAHPNANTITLASLRDPYRQISFPNERALLPACKVYTIDELCGEEDE